MIYLLLHIFFGSGFTLLIKSAQQRSVDNILVIGAINYIAAAMATLPVFLWTNPLPVDSPAILLGGVMGAIYFVNYFLVIRSIKIVGASVTSVVSVLSILFPIVIAAIYFAEQPTFWQTIGIGLALGSLALVSRSKQASSSPGDSVADYPHNSTRWLVPMLLAGFFFLCGVSRVAQELFKHLSQPAHLPAFCLSAFAIASVPSACVLARQPKRPSAMEWFLGSLLGLSNVLQTYFMLCALEHLPGYIAFTIASGGSIVFTTMMATGLMGERVNRKAQVGIGLAVVALVLLRWLPN